MSPRLGLARNAGVLPVESGETILWIGAPAGAETPFGDAALTVLQGQQPDAGHWERRGVTVLQTVEGDAFDVCIVTLPRFKEAAKAQIAAAMASARKTVIIDGQKTDGIESILKEMRKRAAIGGVISKAHGKLFWCAPSDAFADWRAQPMLVEKRWQTRPGVFSAARIDDGSRLLMETVPETLSGEVADLGAGWGYVSGLLAERCPNIKRLHLVEAQNDALDCARANVSDARAVFHWADVTSWTSPALLDCVVMNPPFHSGRAAEPDLGRAFIASAAQNLRPGGTLWMVANRHLPYETTLTQHFRDVTEIAGNSKFKVLRGQTKSRPAR